MTVKSIFLAGLLLMTVNSAGYAAQDRGRIAAAADFAVLAGEYIAAGVQNRVEKWYGKASSFYRKTDKNAVAAAKPPSDLRDAYAPDNYSQYPSSGANSGGYLPELDISGRVPAPVKPAVLDAGYETAVSSNSEDFYNIPRKIKNPPEQENVMAPGYALAVSSVARPVAVPSALDRVSAPEVNGLVAALNGPRIARFSTAERVNKYLYGGDFRVRTVYNTGALAAPVPGLSDDSGALAALAQYRFATVAVNLAEANRAGGLAVYIRRIVAKTGFLPCDDDLDVKDGEVALVRGWLPPKTEDGLLKSGLVKSVKVGKRACDFEPGQLHYTMPVIVTITVPARYRLLEFVETVMGRLNANAGFAWRKTLSARPLEVKDSRGEAAYLVKVSGRLPFDTFRRAASYPFVRDIEPASISDARGI